MTDVTSPCFWELEESVQVNLVETEEVLKAWGGLAEAAVLCGMDAEWPPETTGTNPKASLLQLALWSPQHGLHMVLLDLLLLPKSASKAWLQQLFRNKHTLKVGYSMVTDLRATAAALGGEGGSCVAVVEPALDVGTLHRFLLKHRAPGVRKATSAGLAGLCEAQLGSPLDKSQQCSAWGHRPLSQEQLRYAAGDAACLLAILDDLLQKVEPQKYPMGTVEQEAVGQSDSSPAPGAAAAAALPSGSEPGGDVGSSKEEGCGKAREGEAAGSSRDDNTSSNNSNSSGDGSSSSSSWMRCGEGRPKQAAQWWGARLEVQGGRAVKHQSGRRAKDRRSAGKAGAADFPAHVPWLDAARRVVSAPRFICDAMTEGLARQLRMVGFDADHVQARDKSQRHAIYRSLVERAEEEGRVVLTRDRTFLDAGYTYQAYLVKANTKQQQLQEVLRVFDLQVDEDNLLSRCSRCNGEFVPRPLGPGELPEGHGVPEGIRQQHAEFWICSKCSAVYWQGNQYGHALERLSGMLASLQMQ